MGVEVRVDIADQNNYDIDLGLFLLYVLIYYDDEDVRVIVIIRIIAADVSKFQILGLSPRGTEVPSALKIKPEGCNMIKTL